MFYISPKMPVPDKCFNFILELLAFFGIVPMVAIIPAKSSLILPVRWGEYSPWSQQIFLVLNLHQYLCSGYYKRAVILKPLRWRSKSVASRWSPYPPIGWHPRLPSPLSTCLMITLTPLVHVFAFLLLRLIDGQFSMAGPCFFNIRILVHSYQHFSESLGIWGRHFFEVYL